MSKPHKKILFAAGGTGGHLFPAQALAEQLKKQNPKYEILFAGANLSGNAYFDKSKFSYRDIASTTPFGGGYRKALKSGMILLKGILQSLRLLSREKPDLIVGFGSFHTFPILCAAALKKVPLVLFESNAIPGKVVRLFSRNALFSGIYFSEAKSYLKGEIVEVEIPLRSAPAKGRMSKEEARLHFNLDPSTPTLLVFGGSQGAKRINRKVIEMLPLLKSAQIQLIHSTGCEETAAEVALLCQTLGLRCSAKKFEPQMEIAWSASDIAICRSGAITLSELLHHEVPGILIPFPAAADQHQLKNALFIEKQVGGAVHFVEQTLTPEQLAQSLLSLIAPQSPQRTKMQEAIKHFKAQQKKADLGRLISEFLDT
ncbi:MAG: UDP-N-acetylglucosamine--N-acetylmuramyl-(pentapeptide) pyrophosphoryl-undecaprenol N-acetylglucosamine transferase [Verrucomicrobia bacterium]|nr:UDP-N-acetylglucosamine--N-acetylmuramyl-(pentapeptide) pyrophosphoryl-undecaprenol N-acetylglucosamine transferase [Verrucomicrobiota bacterium]